MSNIEYNILGVMSGTSLDGVDLVYANFNKSNSWTFKILKYDTIKYSKKWHNLLMFLVEQPIDVIQKLDEEYTIYLSEIISKFIQKNSLTKIDAICSHGHTALHRPEDKITLQIGNKMQLASLLKQTVVCDFRVQDVKLGGQGAPLVPIGDQLLFGEYSYCLNLGGFANISFENKAKRVAFDICPVNIVLNHYCRKINFEFDFNGEISSTGTINQNLLNQLNNLDFYGKDFPKSLGLEWVTQSVFPLIDSFDLKVRDVLRTFTEHIAIQINKVLNQERNNSVLITGGGAHNSFLVKRIKSLSEHKIVLPTKEIIDYKEALVFGLLGILKLRGEINCLASVTGSKHDHSSGIIYR